MIRNTKLKTFVWYSVVGLLVLLAVAVSLFRIYFSSVAEYRSQLEMLAGSYLGQPVTISGMDARVVGISPTVILKDVALLDKEGENLLTRFSSIQIALAPVASLRALSPIIKLRITGANLEVVHRTDGSIGVQGLVLPQRGAAVRQAQTMAEEGNTLGAWFLSQSRLAVSDSRISLLDEQSGERFSFDNVELELRNSSERHSLNGFVHLPKSIGRELRVAIDIEGNLLQHKDWRGMLYLKTSQLQAEQWLSQLTWRDTALRRGRLDMELWSHWQGGELESLYSRLEARGLQLTRGGERQDIVKLGAVMHAHNRDGNWRADIADLQLQLDEKESPRTRLTLAREEGAFSLQLERLELQTVAALLPFVPQLDEQQRAMLAQMAPRGAISGLYLHRAADGGLALQGQLAGLAVEPWEKLPGVAGLDAAVRLQDGEGRVAISSAGAELRLPWLFRQPLQLSRLETELQLQHAASGWKLAAPSIVLHNDDLEAQLRLALQLRADSAPWLSLLGRFSAADARRVAHYLPAGILQPASLQWLDNAFRAGRVPGGRLQYHGQLDQFPFRDNQGRFEVLFDAEQVQLHYQDGWPELRQVNGEVHFDGPGMTVAARSARLFEARIGPTRVTIDDFHFPQLQVDGGARLSVNDGLRFLQQSPLSQHTGSLLEQMQGQGQASLGLRLAIPLSARVGERSPLVVDGSVDFDNDTVEVVEGVRVQGLRGRLRFTEASFSAEQLEARLYGKPATIDVATGGGEHSAVVVTASGSGEMQAVREAFALPLLDYLQGDAPWQASLTLPRGTGAAGARLHIESDLVGVSSNLPHPLAKSAAEPIPMTLEFGLSGAIRGERRLLFGERLGLVWREGGEGDSSRLQRAQLRLGGAAPLELPGHDVIELVGSGEGIDLLRWREVLRRHQHGDGVPAAPLPLSVAMQRLQLVSTSTEATGDEPGGPEPQVADFSTITIAIEEFAYDDMPLGRVAVRVTPQGESLVLKTLQITSEQFQFSGSGSWTQGGNTFIDFSLEAPSLGKMMKRLGFVTVIQGGRLRSSGKLWWSGAPSALSLPTLNGQLAVAIKEGTILDIDPGAGRLLGILSIPALPRRLFLDFSDIFREGFAFNSIKGDIRIEQGQGYTSNLQLESVPANILVSGRSGLAARDFDQEIYVVPNVSDTATVASALAWGPQVAAVVALLQELFKSDIKAATMTRYRLTGSWDEPKIRRIREQRPGTPAEDDGPFFVE